MLNICIVDDEHLALQYLDFLLSKIEGVQVTGKFSDSKDLIHHAQEQHIDIVFIDIHMPNMTGIDLAEQLLCIQPSLQIVFVTGYNQYAVKAFELNALDYILKPVQEDRLRLSIERIKERKGSLSLQSPYFIRNLGALYFYKDGQPIEIKWRTAKVKELLTYFIQHHEKSITKGELTQLMWHNLPWEKAHAQLYSTIYQIRKLLEQTEIPIKIVSQDEFYRIDIREIQVQSIKWKQAALQLLETGDVSLRRYLELLREYQGHYLAEMNHVWILEERNDIKSLWMQLLDNLIEYINHHGDTLAYASTILKSFVKFDEKATQLVQEKLNG